MHLPPPQLQECFDVAAQGGHEARPPREVLDRRAAQPPIPWDELAAQSAQDRAEAPGRLASYGEFLLRVPHPGEASDIFAETDRGGVSLLICNPGSRKLYLEVKDSRESSPSPSEPSEPGRGAARQFHTPCSQQDWDPNGSTVPGDFHYRMNVARRQFHLTHDEAFFGLKSGFDGVLTMRNDCGLGDNMHRRAFIDGETYLDMCDAALGDGVNVVGFDDFTDASGEACRVWSNGRLVEADVRVNNDGTGFRFSRTITSSCGHTIHLDSTATHEVGHVYGLRDVPNDDLLTMWGATIRCSTNKATFGRGDWLGIDGLY